jgi:hypothetical protein
MRELVLVCRSRGSSRRSGTTYTNAMSLRDLLRRHIFSTRAARLGTLQKLTKLAPVAIIAEALGYNAKTIETHATASGAEYAGYVAAVLSSGGRA